MKLDSLRWLAMVVSVVFVAGTGLFPTDADARRGGRAGARTSVHKNVNVNRNVSRNKNVNVNKTLFLTSYPPKVIVTYYQNFARHKLLLAVEPDHKLKLVKPE